MNKTMSLILAGLVFGWFAPVAPANAVLVSHVIPLNGKGTVDRVDLDKHRIVIGGKSYRLAPDAFKQGMGGGEGVEPDQLEKGSAVGFQSEDDENNGAVIRKILILPSRQE